MAYEDRDLSQPGNFLQSARMYFRYAPELVLAKEFPEPFRSAMLAEYPDEPLEETPDHILLDQGLIGGMAAPNEYLDACSSLLKLMKAAPDSWMAKFVLAALNDFAHDPRCLADTAYFMGEFFTAVNDFHRDIRTARVIYDRHRCLFNGPRDGYEDFPLPPECLNHNGASR